MKKENNNIKSQFKKHPILSILALILIVWGLATIFSGNDKNEETVIVQPTLEAQENIKTEQPIQKIKSATLIIDRVQIQVANLYPTRVTVTNTGDVEITPKFDVIVAKGSEEICSGSPIIDEFGAISPKEKKPDIIVLLGDILDTHERLHTTAFNIACNFIDKMRNVAEKLGYLKILIQYQDHDIIIYSSFMDSATSTPEYKEYGAILETLKFF